MKDSKRSAEIDHIEKGPHKEEHHNQYGDQRENASKKVRDTSEDVEPQSPTIDGRDNAVQGNAHKDAEQRSN